MSMKVSTRKQGSLFRVFKLAGLVAIVYGLYLCQTDMANGTFIAIGGFATTVIASVMGWLANG